MFFQAKYLEIFERFMFGFIPLAFNVRHEKSAQLLKKYIIGKLSDFFQILSIYFNLGQNSFLRRCQLHPFWYFFAAV